MRASHLATRHRASLHSRLLSPVQTMGLGKRERLCWGAGPKAITSANILCRSPMSRQLVSYSMAYRQFRDMQARDRLVVNYIPLVRRLSNRYRGAIEPPEDLFQVGMIGLLNTIEKFDPSYGTSFSSLAIPEIRGAILNHLRDHGSLIKIPRALKQKKLAVDKVTEAPAPRIGRWPTVGELAQACDLAEEDVNAAMNLGRTGDPRSLDEDLGNDDGEGCATLSDLARIHRRTPMDGERKAEGG